MRENPRIENNDTDVLKEYNPHQSIDRKSPEIITALATAPIYKKFATVRARVAISGERITTTLEDGQEETTGVAQEGDFVITNPSGEQYILTSENFLLRYILTDEAGVYTANGHVRAIKNPFGSPISVLASWGELQYGDENCMIADICDSEGNNMGGEPYIIGADVFAETYRLTESLK